MTVDRTSRLMVDEVGPSRINQQRSSIESQLITTFLTTSTVLNRIIRRFVSPVGTPKVGLELETGMTLVVASQAGSRLHPKIQTSYLPDPTVV